MATTAGCRVGGGRWSVVCSLGVPLNPSVIALRDPGRQHVTLPGQVGLSGSARWCVRPRHGLVYVWFLNFELVYVFRFAFVSDRQTLVNPSQP